MRRIGGDLDVVGGGPVIRSVVMDEHYLVQEARVFEAGDVGSAVAQWLSHVNPSGNDICRLAVSLPGQLCASADPSGLRYAVPDTSQEQFVQASISGMAAESMGASEHSMAVAASIGSVDPQANGMPVFLCGTPRDSLTPIWAALGNAKVDVLPTPLVPHVDGAYLLVRDSTTQLFLVQNLVPLYVKDMKNNGLANLYDTIGGKTSLRDILTNGLRTDDPRWPPLQGFVAQLANEVGTIISQWMTQDYVISRLQIAGPGYNLPGLAAAISSTGIECIPALPPKNMVEAGLPVTETPAAWVALNVACNTFAPAELITGEGKKLRKQQLASTRARALSMGIKVGLAVAAVLLIVLPIGLGLYKQHQAEAGLSKTQHNFSAVSSQYSTYVLVNKEQQLIKQIRQQHPSWATQAQAVLSTVPRTAAVNSFSVTGTPGSVNMSIAISVPSAVPFSGFASWLQALQSLQPQTLQAGVFTYSGGHESLSVALAFNAT